MAVPTIVHRLFLLATVALTAFVVVNATQVMHRPEAYKDVPRKFATSEVKPQVIHKRAGSKVQAAYFTNWGIYGANFQPTDIDPTTLTHIVYAFADVSSDTGAITLTDSYADEQKHFPGDSWDEPGNNLYGCLKQLYLLKLNNRNLKVLLSVGGWTYSQAGHFSFVTDATKRATFVTSAVSMIENYGFDGIDIDFEYPNSADLANGFASLLASLRTAFDNLQKQKGDSTPYQLTAAVPAGSDNYEWLEVPQMNAALTYWNLMVRSLGFSTYLELTQSQAYDYAGSWLTWADNQANLYGGARTNVSTDKAVKWYIANGASANKINMGIPLYGRAFEDTTGIGAPFNGIGPGTTEAGIYSYTDLPLAGAQVFENLTDVSSYSYDSAKKELVSYDTPHIVTIKAQYVQSNGLAGSMFWDLSTDKTGAESLVGTTAGVFGSLDQTQNHINYPNSEWDNIRNNMGTSSSSSTTSVGSPTTTPTSQPTGGSCAGVAAWSASSVYTGGQQATYQGHLWTAKWWTEGDTPGGSAGVWTDNGPC
ncbi:Glycoside Hydrolase Family 18 / Carbohydrate-Binding Module Family 5 protein [Trametes cinnabarina]|uniref:Glycoside Hydrolase Family 18 / Carbohydrate-Binding Module Family 5 protein n=1 Tax=Pycnoporus cinnabarinus TaxID=5643 RepID=A0A060S9U7_PYCCI|nr:Glycoside Hydrolase Family 18 / Carbohydrate-Binding Module Family 5 protein [Trametes cinnabarina]